MQSETVSLLRMVEGFTSTSFVNGVLLIAVKRLGHLDFEDEDRRRQASKMDEEVVFSVLTAAALEEWDVFREVRLRLQEKLRQVLSCFEEDRSVFENSDLHVGEMGVVGCD